MADDHEHGFHHGRQASLDNVADEWLAIDVEQLLRAPESSRHPGREHDSVDRPSLRHRRSG
jgi:hypothetical protein